MEWLGIIFLSFFIYMDTQDHPINNGWINFIPSSLYPRREKKFGLSWNWETRFLLSYLGNIVYVGEAWEELQLEDMPPGSKGTEPPSGH